MPANFMTPDPMSRRNGESEYAWQRRVGMFAHYLETSAQDQAAFAELRNQIDNRTTGHGVGMFGNHVTAAQRDEAARLAFSGEQGATIQRNGHLAVPVASPGQTPVPRVWAADLRKPAILQRPAAPSGSSGDGIWTRPGQ